jgi:O-antigen/teichoic acid export membrane protein
MNAPTSYESAVCRQRHFLSIRKFVINITAMSSVNVVRLSAQFFAIPILSRLLTQDEYGIMGMAMPFTVLAMTLVDGGICMSLVRTSSADWKAWSTCFWLTMLLGLGLGGLMLVLAPVAAQVLGEPRLEPIVMTLALVVFAQATVAIPGASLQQSQQFRLIAVTEIIPVLVGIVTAVIIALRGGGIWALVGQQLAFYAVRVALVLTFSSFRPRLVFDWSSAKEHVIFGRNLMGTNLLGFLTGSAANLVIGKALGSASVGIYAMGVQFASLPSILIAGPLQYVLYAQLAPIKNDTAAIRRAVLFLTRTLALVIFPVVGMIAVAHQSVFDLLLSSKWMAAGELFMIIAPICALQAVTMLLATVAAVVGRTDIQLRNSAEFGILWSAALLTSVWFGLSWVGVALNCAVLAYLPRVFRMALPLIGCSFRAYLNALVVPTILTLFCAGFLVGLEQYVAFGDWQQLGVVGTIAAAGIGICVFLQRRTLVSELSAIRFVPPLSR